MKKLLVALSLLCTPLSFSTISADNQTSTLSPIHSQKSLPFSLEIETADFSLPTGIQAYVGAIYKGKWILLAGRTNGMHGFDSVSNNFPVNFQNTTVYVVDPDTGSSISRSLTESGLSQLEIDSLSVTAAQSFQKKNTLYVVGGYGINSETNDMETKSTLTALNLKRLVEWVKGKRDTLTEAFRQVSDPYLQVTGGFLFQNSSRDPFLLMLGQNFTGLYRDDSNGEYTKQIRAFWLKDDGKHLSILPREINKTREDYRRRDLNIVPVIQNRKPAYVAFAGVFTPTTGVWTVPIIIQPNGSSHQAVSYDKNTFKQAMNQYNCPAFGLYSCCSNEMFVVFPGGISFGYFQNGEFQTDSEFPFINQITTIKMNKKGKFKQYLMDNEYPFIASTGSNPGNQLLFGAEAQFFAAEGISEYSNGVIKLDKIKSPTTIGYIVGGVMSTLPNTNTMADSTSSPYVFKVRVVPKD